MLPSLHENMKNSVFSQYNERVIVCGAVVAACAILLVVNYLHFGFKLGDSAERIMSRGNMLLDWASGNWDQDDFPGKTWSFLIPNLVSGILYRLFGNDVTYAFSAINMLAYVSVALLICRLWTAGYTSGSPIAFSLFAAYLFVGLPAETVKYGLTMVMSDAIAMLIQTAFLYCLFQAVVSASHRFWAWAGFFALLSVFTRPTGFVLIIVLIAGAVYLCLSRGDNSRTNDRIGLVFLFVLPVVVVFLGWPAILYAALNNAHWAERLVAPLPDWVIGLHKHGVVIKGMQESWLGTTSTYWEHVTVLLHRFLYYVVPLRPGYSLIHFLINLVYTLVLISAVVVGWRNMRAMDGAHGRGAAILLSCSLYYSLLYTMILVGHTRYSLALWPALWIVAGFSMLRSKAAAGQVSTLAE